MSGSVHGGQQPVTGATVSLIAPGTTGYGSAGTVIASTTTDALGNFTLPRPYTCPTNSGLVYLLATGGNAGAGTNSAIAEAAIVGPCSALTAGNSFNISEVTTVAAAYALAPFATVGAASTNIGTSATNLQGMTNAAGAANNLANVNTGVAHVTGDFPGIVPPTSLVNTLADILSSCVNQGTSSPTNGACAKLFTATTPSGGVAPVDTFQAALNIALHPASSVAPLFQLATPNAPYQPTLSAAPADYSVALGFNGGAITSGSGTVGIAIDATGNAWITQSAFAAGVHSVTEISAAGVYLSGPTVAASTGFGFANLSFPVGIAIDQAGAVFVANNGGGNVQKFNSNGTLQSTITAASFSGVNGITVDALGNPWVANFSSSVNKVTKITTAGTEAPNSPFTVGFGGVDVASGPLAVWESTYQSKTISRIDLSTFVVTTVNLGDSTAGIAIDHSNNAWFADISTGNLVEINDAGTVLSPPGGWVYPSGSVQSVAVDGLGNIFGGGYVGIKAPGALVEFSGTGTLLSPAIGFIASGLVSNLPETPEGIAIDGSGNVWITGASNGTALPNYVTEVVGIAAPVVTPRAVAVTNHTLGVRP